MAFSHTKRRVLIAGISSALVFACALARAETNDLDLPTDLEAEQQKLEGQGQPPQEAQGGPAQGGGAETPPPDLGAAGADQGAQPDLGQPPPDGDLPEPTLKPANRRTAGNSEDNSYAQPGENPQAPGVQNRASSFSDDEDFLRSQDTIADTNEEDSPHHFHAALVANGGLVNNNNFSQSLGGGIDFEVTLDTHWALGLLGLYNNLNVSVGSNTVSTGLVLAAPTINYYSRRPYEGIWVQFGIGPEFVTGSTNNNVNISANSIVVPTFFSVGWRFLSDSRNLTFAFGLGPQLYLFETPATWVPLVLTIDVVGVAWNIWPH